MEQKKLEELEQALQKFTREKTRLEGNPTKYEKKEGIHNILKDQASKIIESFKLRDYDKHIDEWNLDHFIFDVKDILKNENTNKNK